MCAPKSTKGLVSSVKNFDQKRAPVRASVCSRALRALGVLSPPAHSPISVYFSYITDLEGFCMILQLESGDSA
jgi:hypothetical protein